MRSIFLAKTNKLLENAILLKKDHVHGLQILKRNSQGYT